MTTTMPSHERTDAWPAVAEIPTPRPAAPSPVWPVVAVPEQVRPSSAELFEPAPLQAAPVHLAPARPQPSTANDRAAERRVASPRRWSTAVGRIATGLTFGAVGAVGAVLALSATATVTPDPAPTTPTALPASVSPNVSVPGRALTVIGDGVWQVGVDVEPGTYRSARGDATCRHALRHDRTGADVTAAAGAGTVVLTADDGWFATSGCATWRRVG